MSELMEQYANSFGTNKIPPTLEKLIAFEEKYEEGDYSESFYLCANIYREPDMGQYSLDDEYFERLIEFAQADGTGAKYCFWAAEAGMDLEEAPIVVVGSEGHIQIIANNIKALIQLLSFGPATMDGQFYRDNDWFEDMEHADTFRVWMKQELDVDPVDDFMLEENKQVDQIVQDAFDTHQKAFATWMLSLTPQYQPYDIEG